MVLQYSPKPTAPRETESVVRNARIWSTLSSEQSEAMLALGSPLGTAQVPKRPVLRTSQHVGDRAPGTPPKATLAASPSDLLLLTDPVGPGLCLQVVLGIPVRVKDDDSVRRSQIDSQAAGPCGEQEAEVLHTRQYTTLCRTFSVR